MDKLLIGMIVTYICKDGPILVEFCLIDGITLDGLVPLVTDPSGANFTARKNQHFCISPLYVDEVSVTIMQLKPFEFSNKYSKDMFKF